MFGEGNKFDKKHWRWTCKNLKFYTLNKISDQWIGVSLIKVILAWVRPSIQLCTWLELPLFYIWCYGSYIYLSMIICKKIKTIVHYILCNTLYSNVQENIKLVYIVYCVIHYIVMCRKIKTFVHCILCNTLCCNVHCFVSSNY